MWLFVDIFFHVHPVGVGADLSCPHPRTPTKWYCDTSYHVHEYPQNGIALVLFGNMIFYLFLGIAHLFISY